MTSKSFTCYIKHHLETSLLKVALYDQLEPILVIYDLKSISFSQCLM